METVSVPLGPPPGGPCVSGSLRQGSFPAGETANLSPSCEHGNMHHFKRAISAAWILSFIFLQVEEVLDIHDGLWPFGTLRQKK